MTTVERVDVERLSLPLHSPFTTARRRATTADSVIVRVTDSEGRVGLGEAPQNWPVWAWPQLLSKPPPGC